MSDSRQPPPSKPELGDAAIVIARAGLAAFGGAAGPAAELLGTVLMPPLQRRLLAWLEDLAARVQALEEAGTLRVADLASNPAFLDAFVVAARSAQAATEPEKLEALRSAVLNAAFPGGPDSTERFVFLRLVDRFCAWHLRALALFKHPFTTLSELGRYQDGRAFPDGAALLIHAYMSEEEPAGLGLAPVLVQDLEREGLVIFQRKEHVLSRTGAAARPAPRNPFGDQISVRPDTDWTTPLGRAFLKFIADPATR